MLRFQRSMVVTSLLCCLTAWGCQQQVKETPPPPATPESSPPEAELVPGEPGQSDALTIENIIPTTPTVLMVPEEGTVETRFTCHLTGESTDGDDHAIKYVTSWLINGFPVEGSASITAGELVSGQSGRKTRGGDELRCQVRAIDELGGKSMPAYSKPVVLKNTAPRGGEAIIRPAAAFQDSTLTCVASGAEDLDGDVLTWTYKWEVDGVVVSDQKGATLDGSHFKRGQAVDCSAVASDGIANGPTIESSGPVTILNSKPVIATVTISANQANRNGTLRCAFEGWTDSDGDPVRVRYRWVKVTEGGASLLSGFENETLVPAEAGLVAGDRVRCEVEPYNRLGGPPEDVITEDTPQDGAALEVSDEVLAQRFEVMADDLRNMVRHDELRITNIAHAMVALGERAVDLLLPLASDPVEFARYGAVLALTQLPADRALPVLISRLGDEREKVAVAAVIAVATYPGDWALESLVRWLAHPNETVRSAVLEALVIRDEKHISKVIEQNYARPPRDTGPGPYVTAMGRFPTRQTLKLLVDALDKEAVALDAIRGLVFYGDKATKSVAKWLKKNADKSPAVAAGAIAALVGYGKKGDRALRRLLPKISYTLKEQAVEAMLSGTSRPEKVLAYLQRHPDTELKRLGIIRVPEYPSAEPRVNAEQNLRHRDAAVRILTIHALTDVGRQPDVEAMFVTRYRELARERKPENAEERAKLLTGLGQVGDKAAMTELVQSLAYDSEVDAALAALGHLGQEAVEHLLFVIKAGDPERTPKAVGALSKAGEVALQPLLGLLTHPERAVRDVARQALAEIGDTSIVEAIGELIASSRTKGRAQLLSLLGSLYDDDAFDILRRAARENADVSLRLRATDVLGQVGDPRALPVLRDVARKDDNDEVRHTAVKGLIRQADSSSVELLTKMLSFERPEIRKTAAFGLGYLAVPKDISDIEPQLSTPRDEIISAVRNTMRRISYRADLEEGEDFLTWAAEWQPELGDVRPISGGQMTLADGTVMSYYLHGEGRPLLVLPGGPDYPHDYLRQGLDPLAQDRMLVYVDLPGRGQSALPVDPSIPVGLEHDVQSVATMLTRLNLRDVDVYGHGLGCLVAVRLADKYSQFVDKLILDSSPEPSLDGLRARFAKIHERVSVPWRDDLVRLGTDGERFNPMVRDRWMTLALLTGSVNQKGILPHLGPRITTNPELRRRLLEPMGAFDYRPYYAAINKPTLLIAGTHLPLAQTELEWRRAMANNASVQVMLVPDAGFLPAQETPESWKEVVDAFLN